MSDRYHHGDLRNAIIQTAVAIIAERGVAALSLRAVAAQLGVSHAAPAHHFANKRALLTAIATAGYEDLGQRMTSALASGGEFIGVGVAYVEFALANRATFEVMFDPSIIDPADAEFVAASEALLGILQAGAAQDYPDAEVTALAAWSLVHGFAGLALSGSLQKAGFADSETDMKELARRAALMISGRS